MRILLDTHVVIWAVASPAMLSRNSADLLRDRGNQVFVSAVSAWEIGIKRAAGGLEFDVDLAGWLERAGYATMDIGFGHAFVAGALPPLHRDPFDRMLIAQAQVEGLTIMTADRIFDGCEVAVIAAR